MTTPTLAAAPPPSDAAQAAATLRRMAAALWRHRVAFVAVFLLTAALVLAVAFIRPASYAARAAVLIESSRGSGRALADPDDGPTVVAAEVSEEEVNSEMAVLTSDEVLRATVRDTRLAEIRPSIYMRVILAPFRLYDRMHASFHGVQEPTPEDRAVRMLGRLVAVERMKESNVMVVTLRGGDPLFAKDVLDVLMRHYLDHHLRVHTRYAPAGFFSEQLDIIQDSVAHREAELLALKRDLGVVDLALEREAQLGVEAKLREEAQGVVRRIAEIEGLLGEYRGTLASAAAPGAARRPIDNPNLSALRAQVLQLELEQVRLDTRYNDDFPLVAENRRKLEHAREALAAEQRNVLEYSPTMRAVDQDVARLAAEEAGLRRRLAVLEGQLRGSRARLNRLDAALPAAERAQRGIRTAERRYDVYLTSGDKARVEAALDRGGLTSLSIIQQPAALTTPEGPKKWMLLLLSVGGGLVAAALFCTYLELRSQELEEVIDAIAPAPVTA